MIPCVFPEARRLEFVYSRDPAVIAANISPGGAEDAADGAPGPSALDVYRETGDLSCIVVPDDATRFRLRPLDPGPLASAQMPMYAHGAAVEAARRVAGGKPDGMSLAAFFELNQQAAPALQAFETAKRAVVAMALVEVSGWNVGDYGAVLEAMAAADPALARGLVAELYDRVIAISGLGPLGK